MKTYAVDISPDARQEFLAYLDGVAEFGDDTVSNLLDAFDNCVEMLENTPRAGFGKLQYIPAKYRMIHLCKELSRNKF